MFDAFLDWFLNKTSVDYVDDLESCGLVPEPVCPYNCDGCPSVHLCFPDPELPLDDADEITIEIWR